MHSVRPELLLLFAFTISRKKNQEKRVWEKQKMGKMQHERMCITLQTESKRNPAQPENIAGREDLKASPFHRM